MLRTTGIRLAFDRALAAELVQWLLYLTLLAAAAARAALTRRHRPAIWFTPQRARPWYLARGAALWGGLRAARGEADADIAFYFEDVTAGELPASPLVVLNGGCANVSKSHVAAVFEQVFGRPLRIDPRTARGEMVEKSEKNGVHDGRVIAGPCRPRPGYVYQRCIDTADDAGVRHDLRTLCVDGRPLLIWEKRKAPGSAFSINNLSAALRRPEDEFTPLELGQIARFCGRMGLDWGGLDILRDRRDGQIYIVDVNKTDLGPVVALSWPDKIRSMRLLSSALRGLVAARLAGETAAGALAPDPEPRRQVVNG